MEERMNSSMRNVNESMLRADLSDLGHSFVRELATASKKLAIYGSTHPVAQKAIVRPFVFLGQVFHYRRYLNINLHQGYLYVMNIRLKETVFNRQLIELM